MAKGSKSKSHSSSHSSPSKSRAQRDHFTIARTPLLVPMPSPPSSKVSPKKRAVLASEDRRTFHPEKLNRPVLNVHGRPAAQVLADRPRSLKKPSARQQAFRWGKDVASQTKAVLTFAQPSKVAVCVRRGVRREVLHALKRTGKGAGSSRRRSWTSKIGC